MRDPERPREALEDRAVTDYTAPLWRERPVPADEPEPAPEYVYSTADLPGGRVIGARVRGRRHRHQGANCDDWYEFTHAGPAVCAAVSDGAGSKKLSRIGARESCRAAAGALERQLKEALAARPALWDCGALPLTDSRCLEACGVLAGIVQRSVLAAADAVEAAWKNRSGSPAYAALLGRKPRLEDFSGTLLAAVFLPVGGGECLAAACQVGDGAIALLDARDAVPAVKLLGAAEGGAFAGETAFLTSPWMRRDGALQSRTHVTKCAAGLALLMTDGVADDYFPPQRELPRLYRDLMANGVLGGAAEEGASPGLRLKNWLAGYVERGSFDDRTLVVVSF